MLFTAQIKVDSNFIIKVNVEAANHYEARDKAIIMVADGFNGKPELEIIDVKEFVPVPARCA